MVCSRRNQQYAKISPAKEGCIWWRNKQVYTENEWPEKEIIDTTWRSYWKIWGIQECIHKLKQWPYCDWHIVGIKYTIIRYDQGRNKEAIEYNKSKKYSDWSDKNIWTYKDKEKIEDITVNISMFANETKTDVDTELEVNGEY